MDEVTHVGTLADQLVLHELGSVAFAGRSDALFERHLWLDAMVDPANAYER